MYGDKPEGLADITTIPTDPANFPAASTGRKKKFAESLKRSLRKA